MDASATLTIPLVGPLQSWGLDSRFDTRLTAQEPSFSGVLGLICAAMGRDRSESIEDLLELQFGVRADQEGVLLRDFHTVQGCITSARKSGDTAVTNRWYLADAAFTVALEGPLALLEQIQEALRHPVWTLSLGRKACTPTVPMAGGEIREGGLQAVLTTVPLLMGKSGDRRMVLTDPKGPQSRPDVPVNSFATRKFRMRRVRTITAPVAETSDSFKG